MNIKSFKLFDNEERGSTENVYFQSQNEKFNLFGIFTTSLLMVVMVKSNCSLYLYYLWRKISLLKGVDVSPLFFLANFRRFDSFHKQT